MLLTKEENRILDIYMTLHIAYSFLTSIGTNKEGNCKYLGVQKCTVTANVVSL